MAKVRGWIRAPMDDYLAALEVCISGGVRWLATAMLAAVVSWFVYVPIHELLHAYGCLWSGGEVTRLEIDAIYGAAWLQRWFPFVAVGSEYAGQLTGFDTKGSDLIYLATDALPFLLTIVAGVPMLQAASRRRAAWSQAALFGAAVPIAFAPFVSLTGDFYEMGSILVSRAAVLAGGAGPVQRWRSDDVVKLVSELRASAGGLGGFDGLVIGVACLVAVLLAFATYSAGAWVGDRMVRR